MFLTVSIVLAVACLLPAAGKLLGNPKMRQSAARFGIPWRKYQSIAVAEIAATASVVSGLRWHPVGSLGRLECSFCSSVLCSTTGRQRTTLKRCHRH